MVQLLEQAWMFSFKMQVIATAKDQYIEHVCLIQPYSGGCDAVAGIQWLSVLA
ncbi:hypothetical protein D3C79_1108260 [compost metagenome]